VLALIRPCPCPCPGPRQGAEHRGRGLRRLRGPATTGAARF